MNYEERYRRMVYFTHTSLPSKQQHEEYINNVEKELQKQIKNLFKMMNENELRKKWVKKLLS